MQKLQPDMSDRIYAARMLCVLCMMYVHVPTGIDVEAVIYTFEPGRFDHWLEAFLVEGPGRAGAALLSVVSGFLVARTLLQPQASVTRLYARRFKSTVLPMLFWGLLVYLIYSIVSLKKETFLTDLTGWLDHINVVFFLTEAPFGPTMHLGFLRDLFVCVLLSPLLLFLLKRVALPLILLLAGLYIFVHEQQLFVILRPLVLFAFSLGMLLTLRQAKMDALDRYWGWFLAGSALCTVLIMWVNGGGLAGAVEYFAARGLSFRESVLYPVCRLFGSLAIWTLLPKILSQPVRRLVKLGSAYLFAAFCSHHLMLTIAFQSVWEPLLGARESYVYIVWFVLAPLLAFLLAVLLVKAAVLIAPPMAVLITGGRIDRGPSAIAGWFKSFKTAPAGSSATSERTREADLPLPQPQNRAPAVPEQTEPVTGSVSKVLEQTK